MHRMGRNNAHRPRPQNLLDAIHDDLELAFKGVRHLFMRVRMLRQHGARRDIPIDEAHASRMEEFSAPAWKWGFLRNILEVDHCSAPSSFMAYPDTDSMGRCLDGSSGGIEHDRPPQGKDHVMRASCTFAIISLLATASVASAAEEERKIDPTFLHRSMAGAKEAPSDITAPGCHYKPLFADAVPGSGVARFAIVTLDAGASCKSVSYPGEDQIYVVLNGSGAASYGGEQVALAKEDFLVLPA